MGVDYLKKPVLEALWFYGQMSIQELLYLFLEDYLWIVKIAKELESKTLLEKKIEKCLKQLIREENIREYLCDSGYRRRYGIPKLPISKKIPLKLREFPKMKICKECHFPVVVYKNKIKHILPYHCSIRKNDDDKYLRVINGSDRRYVLYKSKLLGVLDKNSIRMPFKDNKNHIPEFFLALNKYSTKFHKQDLTLTFREVVI